MKWILTAASCLLLFGCTSGGTEAQRSGSASTEAQTPFVPLGSSEPSQSAAGEGVDPCKLLTHDELRQIGGQVAGEGGPGQAGGMPNCEWPLGDGSYIQVIATTSPNWAKTVPEAIRSLERSRLVGDTETLRRLREVWELVERQDLKAKQACALFSAMLELHGRPAGLSRVVAVTPTRQNPLAVTGQTCSSGRFTSVMIAKNPEGLVRPFPLEQVSKALDSAHSRALG